MKVVISQSMLFPWVGFLEQIKLADVFVHYDDVQFSKGSFCNRVQLKTREGRRWLTVPLENLHLGQRIEEVRPAPKDKWVSKHLKFLRESFAGAPFAGEALAIAEEVYAADYPGIGGLSRASFLALARYFGLLGNKRFIDVKDMGIAGSSSERVLAIVKALGGDTYITGLGALKYLDHEMFEAGGVRVEYMNYACRPYPQLHGEFTPYVSGLDLAANCGKQGGEYISSGTISWRELKNGPDRGIQK